MARDNDDRSNDRNAPAFGFDAKTLGKNQRQEPTFSNFDDDEDSYEELDRDTDYTSGYHADEEDLEEYDDDFAEDETPDLFQDEDDDPEYDIEEEDTEEAETWLEKEEYTEDEDRHQTWPLSLIAVAVVALVLLAAGGYGVMQQRAATEEELRELRAALATTSSPKDLGATREALEELQLAYDDLAKKAEELTLENRSLADIVAGLEAQVGNGQAVGVKVGSVAAPVQPGTGKPSASESSPAQPSSATQPAATKPVAAARPATQVKAAPAPAVSRPTPAQPAANQATVSQSSGPWFVNFGSYAARNMAESWAARLRPAAGKVIIAPNTQDGRTLYRLRVIGLADRETAKQVAAKLETDLRVSQLWVGKD